MQFLGWIPYFLFPTQYVFKHMIGWARRKYKEMDISAVIVSLVVFSLLLVCSWLWRMLNFIWWRPITMERNLRRQGIKGTPFLSLHGDLKEYDAMMNREQSKPMQASHLISHRIDPFLLKTIKENGEFSFSWFGPYPRMNIMDPQVIRDVFADKDGHVEKPKINPMGELLVRGVASYEGLKWAKHRKIVNPAFHLEKIKRMVPAFSASLDELTSKWVELVQEKQSCEVDVWPYFQNLTADVISRTAFGSSYQEGNKIFKLQSEQAELMLKVTRSAYIPGLSWFLPTKDNRRMKTIYNEVRTLLRGIIEKREKAMKLGTGDDKKDDLLGLLLESNHEHSNGLTMEDVIEECKLFYLGGQETTSVLLTWTMVALSMHPTWQTRARDEVLHVYGKRKPDFDGLSQLKIVTMILHEVLRLYPPVPIIFRKTGKAIDLGAFKIPPNALITVPAFLVHRSKEFWGEDADEFNPDRFSGGLSQACKHQLAYFPFGWGHRICIGQAFSMTESKLALASILQHFSFQLSPAYAHAPRTVVTLQPQHGAHLILQKLTS